MSYINMSVAKHCLSKVSKGQYVDAAVELIGQEIQILRLHNIKQSKLYALIQAGRRQAKYTCFMRQAKHRCFMRQAKQPVGTMTYQENKILISQINVCIDGALNNLHWKNYQNHNVMLNIIYLFLFFLFTDKVFFGCIQWALWSGKQMRYVRKAYAQGQHMVERHNFFY